MQLFGITRTGLMAMAVAVLALWACIAMEASTRNLGQRDARVSLDRLRRLRQDSLPTAAPAPWHRGLRPSAS